MVGAVSFFLGGAVNAASINIAMLIVGRILLGFGIGFGNQVYVLFVLISSMNPVKAYGVCCIIVLSQL